MKNLAKLDIIKYTVVLLFLIVLAVVTFPMGNIDENEYSESLRTAIKTEKYVTGFEENYYNSIIKTNQNLATQYVDTLLAIMYGNLKEYDELLKGFISQLRLLNMSTEEIMKSSRDINNTALKGFIEGLKENHLYLYEIDGYYHIDADIKYVNEKYGDYVANDLRDVLIYISQDDMRNLYNGTDNKFNYDFLIERIDSAYSLQQKIPNSSYLSNVKSRQIFYYEFLLGANHNEFIDSANNKFNDEYINQLKSILDKNVNEEFKVTVSDFLKEIDDSEHIRTANIDVWILDKIEYLKTE